MQIRVPFGDVFAIEMDGWCKAIQDYPGEVYPGVVQTSIRELALSFLAAVEYLCPFDAVDLGQRFSKAAKFLIHEKEIAFNIAYQLPPPDFLQQTQSALLNEIISRIEREYGGLMDPLGAKWNWERSVISALPDRFYTVGGQFPPEEYVAGLAGPPPAVEVYQVQDKDPETGAEIPVVRRFLSDPIAQVRADAGDFVRQALLNRDEIGSHGYTPLKLIEGLENAFMPLECFVTINKFETLRYERNYAV